ncbi:hypothetical protein ACFS32_22855 [Novosphingobium pokkalii]|uniref:hypothetical protein n=1 Tax=Novosphingobium pokkalii TaxID=1770194 RepID=UPI00363D1539
MSVSGMTRTRPATRRCQGTPTRLSSSSITISRALPVQCTLLGPISRVSALRCTAPRARSVIVQRAPGP